MTIDVDAYGLAAISLTLNDPVTKMPFTNRLTTHIPTVTYLRMKLLKNKFQLCLKHAVPSLGALLFKQCMTCFELNGNSFLVTL